MKKFLKKTLAFMLVAICFCQGMELSAFAAKKDFTEQSDTFTVYFLSNGTTIKEHGNVSPTRISSFLSNKATGVDGSCTVTITRRENFTCYMSWNAYSYNGRYIKNIDVGLTCFNAKNGQIYYRDNDSKNGSGSYTSHVSGYTSQFGVPYNTDVMYGIYNCKMNFVDGGSLNGTQAYWRKTV